MLLSLMLDMSCSCAASVLGHSYIGSQVSGNDGVQEDEDKQRQPEEHADDGQEEALGPWWVHVGAAGGFGVVFVVGNGQHW